MESKIIKIVDEHNIDRTGYKVCAIDVDGSDYVIYAIERDGENDNVFVSKIIKNINGTSSMINIDDSYEKEKLSLVVKELIKYAVDSQEDKLTKNSVSLPSGKIVNIISVMIDKKEQNINVQKTYITTVKKAVTKISEEFYDILFSENNSNLMNDIFPVFDSPFEENTNQPINNNVNPVNGSEAAESNSTGDVFKIESIPNFVSTENNDEKKQDISSSAIDLNDNTVNSSTKEVDNSVISQNDVIPEKSNIVLPVVENSGNSESLNNNNDSSFFFTADEKKELANNNSSVGEGLVFDASKEVNLNEALGEVSTDKAIPMEDIQPIRDFGVDQVKGEVSTPETSSLENNNEKSVSNNGVAGFANNKFFMVIAILIFVGACVFLGYEAFTYFQAVK